MSTQGDGIVKAHIYVMCLNVRRNRGRKAIFAVADMLRGESLLCKTKNLQRIAGFLAGGTRFEHATGGFGDRCSTVEPPP